MKIDLTIILWVVVFLVIGFAFVNIMSWPRKRGTVTMVDVARIRAECQARGDEEDRLFVQWSDKHAHEFTIIRRGQMITAGPEVDIPMLTDEGYKAFNQYYEQHAKLK